MAMTTRDLKYSNQASASNYSDTWRCVPIPAESKSPVYDFPSLDMLMERVGSNLASLENCVVALEQMADQLVGGLLPQSASGADTVPVMSGKMGEAHSQQDNMRSFLNRLSVVVDRLVKILGG